MQRELSTLRTEHADNVENLTELQQDTNMEAITQHNLLQSALESSQEAKQVAQIRLQQAQEAEQQLSKQLESVTQQMAKLQCSLIKTGSSHAKELQVICGYAATTFCSSATACFKCQMLAQ